mmetsp:Transcript_18182/g.45913  ORF Transcript_18182/g.45913 Transcript_18182/m.45913 type:complete len:136 (-) Transcript_18182:609-1016(-)
MVPRKIGYDACDTRGCLRTENFNSPQAFQRCGQCRVVVYCGPECQKADWKARHKHVCKKVKEKRELMKKAGRMLQNLSDFSLSGQEVGDSQEDMAYVMANARQHPAVRERRRQLKEENIRPKGQAPPEGEDPDFF